MSKPLAMVLTLITISVYGQNYRTNEVKQVLAEGKLLYKSEMASWNGTDMFLENYQDMDNIGGYFSYSENEMSKCIFFNKEDNPKIIGTISFNKTYNVSTAKTDLTEREFSAIENDLYQIRNIAIKELQKNEDGFFKFYQNTRPNIIPLIYNKKKKVYILTGPQQNGVVIFGNDYLLTFDKKNNLISKKQLHKNIIPVEYGDVEEGLKTKSTMHTHLPETGNLITATDICTLMLYEKYTKWETHHVVSEKYINIWNCETDQLSTIPLSIIEKIKKDQEIRKKKK